MFFNTFTLIYFEESNYKFKNKLISYIFILFFFNTVTYLNLMYLNLLNLLLSILSFDIATHNSNHSFATAFERYI